VSKCTTKSNNVLLAWEKEMKLQKVPGVITNMFLYRSFFVVLQLEIQPNELQLSLNGQKNRNSGRVVFSEELHSIIVRPLPVLYSEFP